MRNEVSLDNLIDALNPYQQNYKWAVRRLVSLVVTLLALYLTIGFWYSFGDIRHPLFDEAIIALGVMCNLLVCMTTVTWLGVGKPEAKDVFMADIKMFNNLGRNKYTHNGKAISLRFEWNDRVRVAKALNRKRPSSVDRLFVYRDIHETLEALKVERTLLNT